VKIGKEKIIVEECVEEICRYFGIDPYTSISEGTLIISCREHKAQAVVDALAHKGIRSSITGELIESEKGMILIERGNKTKLEHPIVDPFWKAFYGALEKGKALKTEKT
jgi:hydrogenase maturation factor